MSKDGMPDWNEVAKGGDLTEATAAMERAEAAQRDAHESFHRLIDVFRDEIARIRRGHGE